MIDLSVYTSSTVAVPSFALQARDWETIYMRLIGLEAYDNANFQFQGLFRATPAPGNQDLVTSTLMTVGLIARIYEWNYPCGPLPDNGKTRLKNALIAVGGLLAQMVIDKDANISESQDKVRTDGRKRLRGG